MKKKGITIWEQHLEHIVLGVAVLFFIGFGGWQLTRSPNEVNGVAPGDADPQLESAVDSLNTRLAGEPVDLPEYDSIAGTFAARLDRSVSPTDRLVVAAPAIDLGDGTQGDGGGDRLYVTLDLPAPDRLEVRTDYDALLPETLERFPELADQLVSSSLDIEWNTVAARVDLRALEEQYRQSDSGDRSSIPENWYGGRVSILDVRVERQEWDGDAWGETMVVSTLPGAVTMRPMISEATETAREQVFAALENPAVRREIVQPEFLQTLNDTWVAPDPLVQEMTEEEAQGMTEEELETQRLLTRLLRDRKERARLLERLIASGGTDPGLERDRKEEDREQERDRDSRRDPPGGSAPGAPGLGGGEGSGRNPGGSRRSAPGAGGFGPGGGDESGGAAGDAQRDAEQQERLIQRLSRNITQLDRKIERWEDQLRGLGVDLDAEAEPEEEAVDPFTADELAIWAFDIDVDPGATYRYRIAVDLYNPFFRRRIDLSEEQFELAESMTVATDTSDWSEPVEVLPPTSFYVTEAYPNQGDLGMGALKAEVFRFENGRWWKETFSLEPGEVIGDERRVRRGTAAPGMPESIDYGTGWYVLDVLLAVEAGPEDREAGLAGEVLVQRMDEGDSVRLEQPRAARLDRRRVDLDRMVREAEDAAELEAARGE